MSRTFIAGFLLLIALVAALAQGPVVLTMGEYSSHTTPETIKHYLTAPLSSPKHPIELAKRT